MQSESNTSLGEDMDLVDIDEALKNDSFIRLEDKTHDDVTNILQQWKANNLSSQYGPSSSKQAQQQMMLKQQMLLLQQHELTLQQEEHQELLPQRKSYQLETKQTVPQRSYQSQTYYKKNFGSSNSNLDVQSETRMPQTQQSLNWLNSTITTDSIPHFAQNSKQDNEGYKFNSKTFTRPKKGSERAPSNMNLDLTVNNTTMSNKSPAAYPHSPAISYQIGGLVTLMNKSLLQDTSPPSSICSSTSMDNSNNSLVTSADFANINFLQSTQSLDFHNLDDLTTFNLADKTTSDGYTLNDLIRDRKALDSLTMSGDGTLIKDTQIAQIDDISLTTSKTASGCSTMDNSTDSVEGTVNQKDCTYIAAEFDVSRKELEANEDKINATGKHIVTEKLLNESNALNKVTDKQELKENSGVANFLNLTHDVQNDRTFAKDSSSGNLILNDTVILANEFKEGTEIRCVTPEETSTKMLFYESTPHLTKQKPNRSRYPPTIQTDEVNISPITGNCPSSVFSKSKHTFNETYDHSRRAINSKTFESSDLCGALLEDMESEEKEEKAENTFDISNNKQRHQRTWTAQSDDDIKMQNVRNLAQVEAEILDNEEDEENFDLLLSKYSKNYLSEDEKRMKESIDTIRKRFNTDASNENNQREVPTSESARGSHSLMEIYDRIQPSMKRGLNSSSPANVGAATGGERLLSRRSRLYDNIDPAAILTSRSHISNKSYTVEKYETEASETEHINKITNASKVVNSSSQANTTSTNLNTTAIVDDSTSQEGSNDERQSKLSEKRGRIRDPDRFKTIKIIKDRKATNDTDFSSNGIELNVPCIDDDFINHNENFETQNTSVPDVQTKPSQQIHEHTYNINQFDNKNIMPVFNNNKSETKIETELESKNSAKSISSKYLTYKKPKSKSSLNQQKLPEILAQQSEQEIQSEDVNHDNQQKELQTTTSGKTQEQRRLMRPAELRGLKKLNLEKLVSANRSAQSSSENINAPLDSNNLVKPVERSESLENGPSKSISSESINSDIGERISHKKESFAKFETNATKLSKPSKMQSQYTLGGIKSKSFHNLSINAGENAAKITMPKKESFVYAKSLKKPSNLHIPSQIQQPTKSNSCSNVNQKQEMQHEKQQQLTSHEQKTDDAVFKVPKLVSGIRAPGAISSLKRAGLVRPSSGYYSLSSLTKAQSNELVDQETNRLSLTDSMSSASSRCSSTGEVLGNARSIKTVGNTNATTSANKVIQRPTTTQSGVRPKSTIVPATANLTKLTTTSSGIPKPTGLRPPTNFKRSGLPKPSTSGLKR